MLLAYNFVWHYVKRNWDKMTLLKLKMFFFPRWKIIIWTPLLEHSILLIIHKWWLIPRDIPDGILVLNTGYNKYVWILPSDKLFSFFAGFFNGRGWFFHLKAPIFYNLTILGFTWFGEDLFLLRSIEFVLSAHWSNCTLLLEHHKSSISSESQCFSKGQ